MKNITLGTLLLSLSLLSGAANACPDALKFMKRKLNSQDTVNLCSTYKDKAVMIVNTASFCGFTPQFEGLQDLYAKYKDDGFVVLGFPSHDFMNQESDKESETAEICELTYGVKFPMFEPISVKGDDADPMFRILAKQTGEKPSWNFNKYLISKDGKTVEHFGSRTKPDSKKIIQAVEKAIATTTTAS